MASKYEHRLFINNEYVNARSTERLSVRNPYDNSLVTSEVHVAGEEDVDAAVAAASKAFEVWRKTPAAQRAQCMYKLADLIDENASQLGALETIAMGQPISVSTFTTSFVSAWWRYYAGWATKIGGETFPDDGEGIYRIVQYEPLGVCAGLAAWNATFFYTAWKIAPAVAAGNTFIFKSSEKSPLGALVFGDLVRQAGFPPGVINFVSGSGVTGSLLASHMKIAKISFTGSTATGRKVQIAAANSNMKRCTLELGGKSPALVFDDADLDNALGHMSDSFLLNTGQVCAATSRLLVQESISKAFIERLIERFKNATQRYGPPSEPGTIMGPLAGVDQFNRVKSFLDDGKKSGLDFIVGGKETGVDNCCIEPTLVLDPPVTSPVYKEEVFGPVLVIKTFKDEAEAIELANGTIFGLGAAVFTKDIARALRVSSEIRAGSVAINQPVVPAMQVPFGGVKQSGNGREGGREGIMAYLESKTISINLK